MEFNEKLQHLRRQKNLTQEELAEALFVSRAAVSKWESGRGYPNIDSLRAIAAFFSVTVDELLSAGETLTLAEADRQENTARLRSLVFALLDCGAAALLFLPLFGQRTEDAVRAVSLLALTGINPVLRAACLVFTAVSVAVGVLTLALRDRHAFWVRGGTALSLLTGAAGALLCIAGVQPYAAALLFLFLLIKAILLLKGR